MDDHVEILNTARRNHRSVRAMVGALPLRIFLASPGDLSDERAAVRLCINEHASRHLGVGDVTYEVVEWDRLRGTARRAQEAIDELIAECHFMVVLFKKEWGSEPGSPWGYTSGTEEELFTGLLELGQPEQPMRDIWVGFVADPEPREGVVQLRQQIIDRNSLMFESIADIADLTKKLMGRLELWESSAYSKIPVHTDLMPSSGKDVLRAANQRLRGEKLVELGQTEAGRTALMEAAAIGGPLEQLAYAKFLRRAGDLSGAYAATQEAIDYLIKSGPLYSALTADAFSAQARVLSAQDRHNEAVGRLQQALTLLRGDEAYSRTVRCRILDSLGLESQKIDDPSSARANFQEALTIRRAGGDDSGVCQSLINLARLEVSEGNLPTAAEYAHEVIATLRGTPPSGLHANAEVLVAQVSLRQGLPTIGVPHAERAVASNRQIGNKHGEAISLLVLAQCCRAANRPEDAEKYGQESLALNQSVGDAFGATRAQWLLENLDK